MKIQKVRALMDTFGKDLTGDVVEMLQDTIHIISSAEVEWFLDRPTKFYVYPNAEILTFSFGENNVPDGVYLPDGTVKLFTEFGNGIPDDLIQSVLALQDSIESIAGMQAQIDAIEAVDAAQQVSIGTLTTTTAAQQTAINGINASMAAVQAQLNALLAALGEGLSVVSGNVYYPEGAPVLVSVSGVSIASTVEGGNLVYTVTLTGTTSQTQSFALALSGSATSNTDFNPTPTFSHGVTLGTNAVTVPSGVANFTMTFATTDDIALEAAETLVVTVGGVSGTGTITDNDDIKVVSSVSDETVIEGSTLAFTVTLSGTTTQQQSFPFSLGGTATGGDDYTVPLTLSNGVTISTTNFVVPPGVTSFTAQTSTADGVSIEANETVILTVGGVSGTGTIVDTTPIPANVTGVSSQSVVEGQPLVYTVALDRITTQEETYTFVLSGTATASVDYNTSPIFNPNTISLGTNAITVPIGVTGFTVQFDTLDGVIIEPTETLVLTIDGVSGVGTIIDNDTTALSALTRINVFEAPYGLLDTPKKSTVSGEGGYLTVVASRNDLSTTNYAVYTSDTENGTYTKIADNRSYAPHYDVMGAIGYVHDSIGVENLFDSPSSIPADTIGLLYDTSGQQEFSLYQPLQTSTVGSEVAQIFEDTKVAIWDSLPISVGYDSTAHIQLLTNYTLDTTLRAKNSVVYVKVVPKDAGGSELALSSVTPIPLTIIGRANKPYPPRMFSYQATSNGTLANITLDEMFQYPTQEFIRYFHYVYVGNSDRLTEATPSSYWSPNAGIEANTTNYIERLNADGAIAATTTSTTNTIKSISTNWKLGTEDYRIYSKRGTVKSVEQIVTIQSQIRDIGTVTSATIAQVGNDIEVTVNVNAQGNTAPFFVYYDLSGTLITDEAFGTVTATAGCVVENNYAIQVPAAVTQFKLVIPTVSAVGKTLTAKVGDMATTSFFTTNITVT